MSYLKFDKWYQDKNTGINIAVDNYTKTAFSDQTQNNLMELEDTSWWFIYRAKVITLLMELYFNKDIPTIDVGGGNGYTSSIASKKGFYISLIEPNFSACINAKKRGVNEVNCGAVTDDAVLDKSISQITLLDVLEHIESDSNFLHLLNKKMVFGGSLLITVPAFNCLWSSEDVSAGHFRRYRLDVIRNLLESHGFSIVYHSYFMSFLFLPILFIRVLFEKVGLLKPQYKRTEEERKKIANAQFSQRKGLVNLVLSCFENIELGLIKRRKTIPFGSSIIVLAKKND